MFWNFFSVALCVAVVCSTKVASEGAEPDRIDRSEIQSALEANYSVASEFSCQIDWQLKLDFDDEEPRGRYESHSTRDVFVCGDRVRVNDYRADGTLETAFVYDRDSLQYFIPESDAGPASYRKKPLSDGFVAGMSKLDPRQFGSVSGLHQLTEILNSWTLVGEISADPEHPGLYAGVFEQPRAAGETHRFHARLWFSQEHNYLPVAANYYLNDVLNVACRVSFAPLPEHPGHFFPAESNDYIVVDDHPDVRVDDVPTWRSWQRFVVRELSLDHVHCDTDLLKIVPKSALPPAAP